MHNSDVDLWHVKSYCTHTLPDNSVEVTLERMLFLLREKVSSKWRDFGDAVGIDEVVLESIAKTTFSHNCIVEVLDYWLKYSDEKLTWKDVADALRDIDLYELAQDIEKVYETGEARPN